jgi:hypothetical protein
MGEMIRLRGVSKAPHARELGAYNQEAEGAIEQGNSEGPPFIRKRSRIGFARLGFPKRGVIEDDGLGRSSPRYSEGNGRHTRPPELRTGIRCREA